MKTKRLFTLLAACCMAWITNAQTREMMGGIQLTNISSTKNSQAYNSIGVGARFHYELMNQLLLAPKANIFFGEANDSWWAADVAVDLHYNFVAAIDFYIYPIIGICATHWSKGDYFSSSNYLGGNFGIGAQYNITSNITLNGEYKYQLYKQRDVMGFAMSVGYRF